MQIIITKKKNRKMNKGSYCNVLYKMYNMLIYNAHINLSRLICITSHESLVYVLFMLLEIYQFKSMNISVFRVMIINNGAHGKQKSSLK